MLNLQSKLKSLVTIKGYKNPYFYCVKTDHNNSLLIELYGNPDLIPIFLNSFSKHKSVVCHLYQIEVLYTYFISGNVYY